jgi:hypothetical protein
MKEQIKYKDLSLYLKCASIGGIAYFIILISGILLSIITVIELI